MNCLRFSGVGVVASDYHVDGQYDTASGDSDSDSEAGGKKSKSRGGQRAYVSNVPAARNVALTPWGTPVENLDSPKTKKLDRVPSMPLGKLLPTSRYGELLRLLLRFRGLHGLMC